LVLQDWNFDPTDLPEAVLVDVAIRIFKSLRVDTALKVSDTELRMLIAKVASQYNQSTQYHCFRRGIMVLQAAYMLLATV
jgi:hypothetical protein